MLCLLCSISVELDLKTFNKNKAPCHPDDREVSRLTIRIIRGKFANLDYKRAPANPDDRRCAS
jgi:hypothetical protein